MLIVNTVLSHALVRHAQQEAYPSPRVKRRIAATTIQMAVRRYLYRTKVKRHMAVTAELCRVQAVVEQYLLAKQKQEEYKEQEEEGEVGSIIDNADVGEVGSYDVGGSYDVEEVGVGSDTLSAIVSDDDDDDDDDDDGDDGDNNNNEEEVGSDEEYDNPGEDDEDHCDTCACVEGLLGGIIKFFSGMFGHRNTGNAMGPPTTPPPRAVIDGGYLSSSSLPVTKRQRQYLTSPTAARASQWGIAYGGDLTSPTAARASQRGIAYGGDLDLTSPTAARASQRGIAYGGDLTSPPPARAAAAAGENLTPSQQNQRVTESTRKPGPSAFYDDKDDIPSARRDASSTLPSGSGKPKDEEVRSVGKPKEEEDVNGNELWGRFRRDGYKYDDWKNRQYPDVIARWFKDQDEWDRGSNDLASGSVAIPGSTWSPIGMKAVAIFNLGHFDPWERRADTQAHGILRMDEKKLRFKEQCWNALSKFQLRVITMVYNIPKEKEDDLRNLYMSTMAVCNRLIGDHPHNWHSSGQNQDAYDKERSATDPLMKDMLKRLMTLLSDDVVVLPYGKNNTTGDTSVYNWLPEEYFVSKDQMPHMLLIRMGWLTPKLRLSLIKSIIKLAGRLLNYSQDDIDAKLSPSYLTSEILDKIVKCRSPRKSNGQPFKKGDLVTNTLGQIEKLDFDPATIDDFRAYVTQWQQEQGQGMLLGANLSMRAASANGREDSVGFFFCTKCGSGPQLRAVGARHVTYVSRDRPFLNCGRWEMVVNANGDLTKALVPGYCDRCSARGLLQHEHKCSGSNGSRTFQCMQPPLDFDPSQIRNRNVMCARFDSSSVLEKSWVPGHGNGFTAAATEVYNTAVRLFGEDGNVTGLQPWMITTHGGNTRVVSAKQFHMRMSDIIIGRGGIEDGSFEIDDKIYSGIPIELPVGHATGRLSAPKFRSVWSSSLYDQYFPGNR